MSNFISTILDYIHVPKCGGCHSRMSKLEIGMCDRCKRVYLDEREEYCDYCGMAAAICTCVPYNMRIKGCMDYRKLVFYRNAASASVIRNMIYSVKRKYNLALIRFFASELYNIDKGILPPDSVVTFAPRMQKSVKKYGYDQGKLLAEHYAKIGGYNFATLLRRKQKRGQSQQKLLNYRQRSANVKDLFTVFDEKVVKGKDIILIDDVVTSGSTLGECVSVLYDAGARTITCRSIANTYRKNKRKND